MIAYLGFRFLDFILMILPWPVVYGIADFAFFILFRVVRYRVDLVRENFRLCFPEKDDLWVNQMTETYYRYLAEIFIESIKAMHMPIEKLLKRYQCDSNDILQRAPFADRNIIIMGSHYGNWEFMTRGLPHLVPHLVGGVYRPLSNTRIEAYMAKHRSSEGMWLVPADTAKAAFVEKKDRPVAYALLADQNPSNPKSSFWINFLNRETGFTPGGEVYARRYDYPVVLMLMRRVKRGHYTVQFEPLAPNPQETEFGYIMRRYAGILEEWIREDPPYWLWSHRRWKHRRPADMEVMDTLPK